MIFSSTVSNSSQNMNRLSAIKEKEVLFLASLLRNVAAGEQLRPFSVSGFSSSQNNNEVARFPVQPLDKTLDKYLRSIEPLVNKEEYKNTCNLVQNFNTQVGIGPKLQNLLQERAKATENWFQDYWINTAYLEYRDPVVIFSSPGLVWPQTHFKSIDDQIQYATTVISGALDFNDILLQKKIPQEKMGNSLLDMQQYYKILGTTRVPKRGRDEMVFQDSSNPSDNIVVMYRNNLFNVVVYEERRRLSDSQIYEQLKFIINTTKKTAPAVGALTSNNRDDWAEVYEYLSLGNNKSLKKIQTALFVVCIDEQLTNISPPNERTRTSALVLHGCGVANGNCGNRWYDKTIQFIIGAGSDGCGINYEHSPAEGGPIGVLTDSIINKISTASLDLKSPVKYPKPELLEIKLNDKLLKDIKIAGNKIDSLVQNLDLWGFSFDKFGKNRLKTLKVSPDSFIQIAIQLAFYKVHGVAGAQYESGSLRKFLHGRTDIIRTCSKESLELCKYVADKTASNADDDQQLYKLLRSALDSHKHYVSLVVNGEGVDRHLLGLKLIAMENKIELPQLFTDASFKKSTYFRLSTSNVPSKCDGFMIYGPLVKDGYACCYNPRDNSINFGTSAWKDCDSTVLKNFKQALEDSLVLMEHILSAGQQSPLQSKL